MGAIGWVETTYGVHLIEVLDRRSEVEEARVAYITRKVGASATTARDAYAQASEFAINATDKESLMAAAAEAGYSTGKPTALPLPRAASPVSVTPPKSSAGPSAASKGDLQPHFDSRLLHRGPLGPNHRSGEPTLEAVEEEMRTGAMNQAKGELYAEKMVGANLDEVAAAVGETVKTDATSA